MAKDKLRYLGTGPGQGDGVSIGGIQYERNEIYEVDEELKAVLLRKGGFELVRPKPKQKPVEEPASIEEIGHDPS